MHYTLILATTGKVFGDGMTISTYVLLPKSKSHMESPYKSGTTSSPTMPPNQWHSQQNIRERARVRVRDRMKEEE